MCCAFIYFGKIPCPVHLFHIVRLLDTSEQAGSKERYVLSFKELFHETSESNSKQSFLFLCLFHSICFLGRGGGGLPQRRFTKQTLLNKKDKKGGWGRGQKFPILRQHSLWMAPFHAESKIRLESKPRYHLNDLKSSIIYLLLGFTV